MTLARIYRTPRGTFRLFEPGLVEFGARSPSISWTALDLRCGACNDFASEADAISWMQIGKPAPLPKREPTPEEIAEFERVEAEVDELYGPDGDPLADL